MRSFSESREAGRSALFTTLVRLVDAVADAIIDFFFPLPRKSEFSTAA